jgi:hypothetical protein
MEGLLASLRAVVGPHATDEALRAVLASANNNLEIAISMYFEMHHYRESKVEAAAHSKVLALKPPKATPASLMANFLGQSGAPPPSVQMMLGSGKGASAGSALSARGREARTASIGPHRDGTVESATTGHSQMPAATAAAGRSLTTAVLQPTVDGARATSRSDDDDCEVDGSGKEHDSDELDVINLDSSQASVLEEFAVNTASSSARTGARVISRPVRSALAPPSGEAPGRRAATPDRSPVGCNSGAGAEAGLPWSSPSGHWPKALKPIFVATHRSVATGDMARFGALLHKPLA